LQAFQFVAIARGLPHVLFEIDDRRLEIMPCQTLRRGETGIDRDMVLLIDGAQNIRDPAFDRGGVIPLAAL